MPAAASLALPPEAFAKDDADDDALFYRPTRLVRHIDDAAASALTAHYARRLAPGADVLDLMSSWVSHLPALEDAPVGHVLGHGMNAEELAANLRLDRWWVQDLNRDPVLPLPGASRDAARRGSCGGRRRRRGRRRMLTPLPPPARRRCRYGMGPRWEMSHGG